MKVVHLSTFSSYGGAAIATYRIHKRLLERGIESAMISLYEPDKPMRNVSTVNKGFMYKLRDYIFYRADNYFFQRKLKKNALPFSFNYFKRISIKDHPLIKSADVVCLYWVGANFLTAEQIGQIQKPIVWRLSDKWVFTGGCHHSGTCIKYQQKCGNCPQLITDEENDFTRKIWKRKNRAWKDQNITVVSPSRWMENEARSSSLLQNKSVIRIPTGVDHDLFQPSDKNSARKYFNINTNKKVVLFGAVNPFKTSYKGSNFFSELVSKLQHSDIHFLVFGSEQQNRHVSLPNVSYLGVINDEKIMATAYNAADVFINPATQDTLPNTVLEAMACGIPCVAFRNSGGVEDVIKHKSNGYLANLGDADDLANGINWIISSNATGEVSTNARDTILNEFTLDKQVELLLSLYASMIPGKA